MLSGISIVCFFASYLAALVLELSRLYFRLSLRLLVIVGFVSAGLLAHTVYLAMQMQTALRLRESPLSNWYHWLLISAWVLAAIYLVIMLSHPRNPVGVFFLPLVLALIGLAQRFPKDESFPVEQASRVWGVIHGMLLTFGTASVMAGFAAGVMYLFQSYRLKQKNPRPSRIRLPSLEWLGKVNERSLIVSTAFLAGGLGSGIVLNLIKGASSGSALPWSDPVVWTSAILLAWLAVITVFGFVYRPARHGRKVAYLTLGSFAFLVLVLGIVLSGKSEHVSGQASITVPPIVALVSDNVGFVLSATRVPQ